MFTMISYCVEISIIRLYECYNLAETDEKIEIRNQRDKSGKFSISTAQHDMLRTLDGYDDSGD